MFNIYKIINITALPNWVGHVVSWTEAIALVIGLLTISILLTQLLIHVTIKIYQLFFIFIVIIKEKVKLMKIKK